MKKIIHKHTLATRWFHWVNFPLLAIMIWSGMLIYWANDVYRLGWADKTLVKFFPNGFYQTLKIPFRLAEGMSLHFFFMWFFALNGVCYVIYLLISGEWRWLVPKKSSFRKAWLILLYDLRIGKKKPTQIKYNAAQRIAYTLVILMGFFMLLTGVAIYKPVQFQWLCNMLGGYESARAEHFYTTMAFVLFFLVHVIQVIRAGWNNFSAMIRGFEVKKNNHHNNLKPNNQQDAQQKIV